MRLSRRRASRAVAEPFRGGGGRADGGANKEDKGGHLLERFEERLLLVVMGWRGASFRVARLGRASGAILRARVPHNGDLIADAQLAVLRGRHGK